MTPTTNEQVRTALAWRRTALALVILSLAIVKLIDWTGPGGGAVLGFACVVVAAVIVGFAEHGVRRMGEEASRPILPLISATAMLIMILAAAGMVLAITA
jgi:uncharacterized membrane protein YidH (DUF202 family)